MTQIFCCQRAKACSGVILFFVQMFPWYGVPEDKISTNERVQERWRDVLDAHSCGNWYEKVTWKVMEEAFAL